MRTLSSLNHAQQSTTTIEDVSTLDRYTEQLAFELCNALVMSFEKAKDYSLTAIERMGDWVQHLFVDTIIHRCRQLDILAKELKLYTKAEQYESILNAQESALQPIVSGSPFFKDNFGFRLQEIYHS